MGCWPTTFSGVPLPLSPSLPPSICEIQSFFLRRHPTPCQFCHRVVREGEREGGKGAGPVRRLEFQRCNINSLILKSNANTFVRARAYRVFLTSCVRKPYMNSPPSSIVRICPVSCVKHFVYATLFTTKNLYAPFPYRDCASKPPSHAG